MFCSPYVHTSSAADRSIESFYRIVLALSLLLCPDGMNLLDGCFPQHLAQTVGVARPSDFDEHVAAASMFHGADELVVPIQNALRCAVFSTG